MTIIKIPTPWKTLAVKSCGDAYPLPMGKTLISALADPYNQGGGQWSSDRRGADFPGEN